MANSASTDATFVSYNSPLDTFSACRSFKVYDVTWDTTPVRMTGPIAKRRAPTAADMVTLAANSVRDVSVDLSNCFEFEEGHSYVARVESSIRVPHTNNGKFSTEELRSRDVTFQAPSSSTPKAASRANNIAKKTVMFNGCSMDAQSTIETAIVNANTALANAVDEVLLMGCGNYDYTRFFGPYNRDRYVKQEPPFGHLS